MKHTRREALGALLAGAATLGGIRLAAADSASQLPEYSRDGFRSGPLGPADAIQTLASERPVAMIVPDAEVDSEVEVNHIVDGQMLNPTGPWVVSWYEGTGLLHEKRRNMLFSGHVDYWGVGPSIFRYIASLQEGAEIEVLGEKGGRANYAVEFVERVTLAEMTPEKMRSITAPTPFEALTIITCGGEFDYNVGEYLQRDVIRARLIQSDETGTRIGDEAAESEEATEIATETPAVATDRKATVTQYGVNVRPSAGTSGAAIGVLNTGDTVTVQGDPVSGDGYSWYAVTLTDGRTGFVVSDFLEVEP